MYKFSMSGYREKGGCKHAWQIFPYIQHLKSYSTIVII